MTAGKGGTPRLVVIPSAEPGPEPERDSHLRQLAAHGWAYRRLLRRGVLALWALAAVELFRLGAELWR